MFSYTIFLHSVFSFFVMQRVYSILLWDCSLQHGWTAEEKRRWYNYTVLSPEDLPRSGLYFFPISMSAERNTWILYSVTFSCDPLVISVILLWYVCLTNLEVEISLKMIKCFSPNYLCMSPSSKFHKPRALQLLNGYSTVLQRQNTNSLFGFFLSGTESGTSLRTRCSPNFEGWR